MGGDGGSIPGRADLVVEKRKEQRANRSDRLNALWKHCQLSQQLLRQPISACRLGRLYNKESVLELLLDRKKVDPTGAAKHVKKMKDVRELHLSENVDKGDSKESADYVCPIVGLHMNGTHSFLFLWSCGCVISDRGFKLIGDSDSKNGETRCPACNKLYVPDDKTPLNPDIELESARKEWLGNFQKKSRNSRKSDNREKQGSTVETEVSSGSKLPKRKVDDETDDDEVIKKKKSNTSSESKSVQEDSTKSDVFKKLFTTSKNAANNPKDNDPWVTYNPYFR